MKKYLKTGIPLSILLAIVFIVPQIFGQLSPNMKTAPVNPQFLKYQQMRTSNAAQTKRSRSRSGARTTLDQGENLGLIPDPLISQIHQMDTTDDIFQSGPYSSADPIYDGRDPNHDNNFNDSLLPPVRNQGACGACWAFAGYGAIESHLKSIYQTPDDENDFAEKHLLQHHGFDVPQCNGGNMKMIAAYLSRNSGPVLEIDDPYTEPLGEKIHENHQSARYFEHMRFMPVRSGADDLLYIKNAILQHGALYTSILFNTENYNENQFSYYYDDPDNSFDDSNHAVVIVGWDDTFQIPEAPGNGAFIVRNSLGENWGDNGYFYVSYHDESIARTKLGFFQDDINFTFDVIYQYDDLGWTGSIGSGDSNDSAANVFTVDENIAITAIGFYATSVNMSYHIQIYRNFENLGGYCQPSEPLIDVPLTGTLHYSGFYTIKLKSPVRFFKGEQFAVVIKFDTPENPFPIPIEAPISNYAESVEAHSSQSYVSDFGNIFFELQNFVSQSNVCIKAYGLYVDDSPPTAFSQELWTDEETPLDMMLSGESSRSHLLNYLIIRYPNHGVISGNLPQLTYSPDINFYGLDSLDFLVNDGTYNSQAARISITVNPVNDPPYAWSLTLETYEDQPIEFSISGFDPDGDPLELYIEDPLMYGILSGNYPNYIYTPDSHFFGDDSIRFQVSDGRFFSNNADIVFNVIAVNDPPIINDMTISTVQNTPVVIEPVMSDVDSFSLTPVIQSMPLNGVLIAQNQHFVYTPNELFIGSDQFIWCVTDGHLFSLSATVSITVNQNTNLPVAQDIVIIANLEESTAIDLSDENSTRDSATYHIKNNPLSGELDGTPPHLIYTPTIQTGGFDWFTYTIRKNNVSSVPATVRIFIIDHNKAPVAENKSYTLIENTPQNIILTANDADNDPLSFSISVPPSHGTLSGTTPNLVYTPDENYIGTDQLYFKANDGKKVSPIASIVLNICPLIIDTKPVANTAHLNIPEDTDVSFTLKGKDPNGDSLTYMLLSQPTHGQITGIAPHISYIPEKDYHGLACFTFQVSDGVEISDPAGVTITISPVNDSPIADDATIITNKNVARRFELSFHDVDSTSLTFQLITEPSHGTITFDFPEMIYNPDLFYSGKDDFSYIVNDGSATSEPANVTIIIPDFYVDLDDPDLDLGTHPPDLSEISIQSLSDEAIDFTLTDLDGGDVTLTITSSNETLITITNIDVAGSGSNSYTHTTSAGVPVPLTMAITSTADQYGSATITITAEDPDGLTGVSQFMVYVSPPGPGMGIKFNEEGQSVTAGIATSNTNFCMELWMNWKGDFGNYPHFVSFIACNGSTGTDGYAIYLTPDDRYLGYYCSSGFGIGNIGRKPEIGVWEHVALVVNEGNLYFYVNGVLELTDSGSPSTLEGGFSLGNSGNPQEYYIGQVDELRIWDAPRSATQIRENMCKRLTGNETNLVTYYRFGHSSGTFLADLSGHGNHATLVNMSDINWVTSGAAIGDVSVYDYTGSVASDFVVNLTSSDGDQFTAIGDAGSYSGLNLYLINESPNITTPPDGWNDIDTNHYWGVFSVGISPTFEILYNYNGNPFIIQENSLKLAYRENNATNSWTQSTAVLNTDENTISKSNDTSAEYVLADNQIEISDIPIQQITDSPTTFTITDKVGGDFYITVSSSNETIISNTNIDLEESGTNSYTFTSTADIPVPLTVAFSNTADQFGFVTLTVTAQNSNGVTYTYPLYVIISPSGAGNALYFDGSNDYIDLSGDVLNNSEGSIEHWVKLNKNDSSQIFFYVADTDTNGFGCSDLLEIHTGIDDNSKAVLVFQDGTDSSGFFTLYSSDLSVDVWYHIAATWDTSGMAYLYVNGHIEDYTDMTGYTFSNYSADRAYIGKPGWDTRFLEGKFDEVRIWNVSRTATQVRENMCKRLTGNESGLVAYYRFDHNSGTTLADLTGNNYHGTLLNMDNSDWVTSGAAIGNVSVYDYTGSVASDFEVNLASSEGDQFTATGDGGTYTGIQLYLINDAPYITTPPNGWNSIDIGHYWGIVPVGTDPTVSISYNYSGNTYYTDENANRLAFRQNNSVSTWSTSDATLNTDTNTFSASGYTSAEIILGQNSPPEISDIGLINTEISTSTSIDFTITFSESKLLTIGCLSSNTSLIESAGITINQTNGGTYTYTSTAGIAEDLSLTLSPIAAKIGVSTLTMTVTTSNGLSTAIALTVAVMNDYQKVETGSETSSSGGFLLTASNITEYALLGHDGYTGTTSVTLSTGEKTRWNRLWYIQKNGTMDSTITFDFTEADIVMPGAQYQYCILKSTDTTGFEALSGITSTISGNQASFTLDDSDLEDDTYYTLAYNRVATSITLSRSVIYDKIPIGSVVGVLSNNDPDTDETHTYSFVSGSGSDDNNAFTIQDNQLKTNTSIDMDVKNAYNIRIRVSDGNAGVYDAQMTIIVSIYITPPVNSSNDISRSNPTGKDGTLVGDGNVRGKIINPKMILFHRIQVK